MVRPGKLDAVPLRCVAWRSIRGRGPASWLGTLLFACVLLPSGALAETAPIDLSDQPKPCSATFWYVGSSWFPSGIVTDLPRPWLPTPISWSSDLGLDADALAQLQPTLVDSDGANHPSSVFIGVPDLWHESVSKPGVCSNLDRREVWVRPDAPLPHGSYTLRVQVPSPAPNPSLPGCYVAAPIDVSTSVTITDQATAGPTAELFPKWNVSVPQSVQYPSVGSCQTLVGSGKATACPDSEACCSFISGPSLKLNVAVYLNWPGGVEKGRYVVAVWQPNPLTSSPQSTCFGAVQGSAWHGEKVYNPYQPPEHERCVKAGVYDLLARTWGTVVEQCLPPPVFEPGPKRPPSCDAKLCSLAATPPDAASFSDTADGATGEGGVDGWQSGTGDLDPDLPGGTAKPPKSGGCAATRARRTHGWLELSLLFGFAAWLRRRQRAGGLASQLLDTTAHARVGATEDSQHPGGP